MMHAQRTVLEDLARIDDDIFDATSANEAFDLHLRAIGILISLMLMEPTTKALDELYAQVEVHRLAAFRLKRAPKIPPIAPMRSRR